MSIDLKTLEEVVERAVRRALEEARSEEMKAVAEALKALADYTKAGFAHLNRRVSTLEDNLGSLTEATLSRYVWEDVREEVRARGEVVLARRRNARVDGLDVDLLVETDRSVYVVEVKTRARRRDVDAVVKKADAARGAYGKPAVAILAGVRIGDDVEKYAKGKGVLVYRY